MNNYKKRLQLAIMLVVLVIAVLTVSGNLTSGHKYPKTGDKAPDFALTGLDGKTYRLSELKGKTVLINFWAVSCKPCREEMPAIQKQAQKWSSQQMVVLGLNIGENKVTVQSFIDQLGIQFPILLDDQEEIRRRYGVNDYPTTFFIDPNGRVNVIKVGQMEESFIDSTFKSLFSPDKGGRS